MPSTTSSSDRSNLRVPAFITSAMTAPLHVRVSAGRALSESCSLVDDDQRRRFGPAHRGDRYGSIKGYQVAGVTSSSARNGQTPSSSRSSFTKSFVTTTPLAGSGRKP